MTRNSSRHLAIALSVALMAAASNEACGEARELALGNNSRAQIVASRAVLHLPCLPEDVLEQEILITGWGYQFIRERACASLFYFDNFAPSGGVHDRPKQPASGYG